MIFKLLMLIFIMPVFHNYTVFQKTCDHVYDDKLK